MHEIILSKYDGDWIPTQTQVICNEHFIGNAKSDSEISPSFVPSLFSLNQTDGKKKK